MADYTELVKFLRGLSPWAFPEASNKRMKEAADAIEALQAEVKRLEPKRGEWVEDEYGFIHCSECRMEWDEPEHTQTNYCPNCGAKMTEVQDG